MSSSAIVFLNVRGKALASIEANGLDGGFRVFERLSEARAAKGRVLVVKRKAALSGSIRPKDILNARPFRRAVRVTAGGGVVIRRKKGLLEVVLIFRKGKWDLPKGKRDRGESRKECAIREVQEELGIEDVRVFSKLDRTTHGYRARKRRYLVKDTHWYLMRTRATAFVPQAKERITDAQWVPLEDAINMVAFKALRQLLRKARTELSQAA